MRVYVCLTSIPTMCLYVCCCRDGHINNRGRVSLMVKSLILLHEVYIITYNNTPWCINTTFIYFLCFRERLCAFCYCGDHSLLGQGNLQVFSTTPQLETVISHKDGGGLTSDSSDGDETTQPEMARETISGERQK